MSSSRLTPAELAAYERDGYLLLRKLFDAQEVAALLDHAKRDEAMAASAYGRKDATGAETKLALWNHPGDDLYGMFSRSPRIVERMEQLLGGEVYHYHTKMMLKEPFVGEVSMGLTATAFTRTSTCEPVGSGVGRSP